MATYSTNQFRAGLKIMLDGAPCNIVENEFVKPGKGQAFNRARIRNLKTGRVIERTFKSGDTVEAADVVDKDMQYLYNDGDHWHFMDPESFEQLSAGEAAMAEARQWLKGQETCVVTLWNGEPLAIAAPNFAVLEITETDPVCAVTRPPAAPNRPPWRPGRWSRFRSSSRPGRRSGSIPAPVYTSPAPRTESL